MVDGVKEIYEILGWDKEAKSILAAALKSGDVEAKAVAVALINRLDARGLYGTEYSSRETHDLRALGRRFG